MKGSEHVIEHAYSSVSRPASLSIAPSLSTTDPTAVNVYKVGGSTAATATTGNPIPENAKAVNVASTNPYGFKLEKNSLICCESDTSINEKLAKLPLVTSPSVRSAAPKILELISASPHTTTSVKANTVGLSHFNGTTSTPKLTHEATSQPSKIYIIPQSQQQATNVVPSAAKQPKIITSSARPPPHIQLTSKLVNINPMSSIIRAEFTTRSAHGPTRFSTVAPKPTLTLIRPKPPLFSNDAVKALKDTHPKTSPSASNMNTVSWRTHFKIPTHQNTVKVPIRVKKRNPLSACPPRSESAAQNSSFDITDLQFL